MEKVGFIPGFLKDGGVELLLHHFIIRADSHGREVNVPNGVRRRGDGGDGRESPPLNVHRTNEDPA